MSDEVRTIVDGDEVDMAKAPLYAWTGKIRAVCMPDPFVVLTPEGMLHGEVGDYLCERILSDGSPGDRFAVAAKRFSASWHPAFTGLMGSAPCEPGEFGADVRSIPCPDRGEQGHSDTCTVYEGYPGQPIHPQEVGV